MTTSLRKGAAPAQTCEPSGTHQKRQFSCLPPKKTSFRKPTSPPWWAFFVSDPCKTSALPAFTGRALALSQQLHRHIDNAENTLNHHQGGHCFRCRRFLFHCLKCRPTASCRSRGERIIAPYALRVKAIRYFFAKKKNKETAAPAFTGAAIFFKQCRGTTPCALIQTQTCRPVNTFQHATLQYSRQAGNEAPRPGRTRGGGFWRSHRSSCIVK